MADVFAVFEGGGVKGIAHVGALARFHEEKQLRFKGYAGTSVGAIVAALAAVGYKARNPMTSPSSLAPQDINMIMAELDFTKLLGDDAIPINKLHENFKLISSAIPLIAELVKEWQQVKSFWFGKRLVKTYSLFKKYNPKPQELQILQELFQRLSDHKGIYTTDPIITWLRPYLNSQNNQLTFESLNKANNIFLKIVATEVMNPKPHIFGLKESSNSKVASAIRASISIPLFFRPYIDEDGSNLLVDGGLRSNYPLGIFESERLGDNGKLPIIGFRLVSESSQVQNQFSANLGDYVGDIFNAALQGASWMQDRGIEHVVEVKINIPATVQTTSFNLTNVEKENLLLRGYEAANRALSDPDNKKLLGLP